MGERWGKTVCGHAVYSLDFQALSLACIFLTDVKGHTTCMHEGESLEIESNHAVAE